MSDIKLVSKDFSDNHYLKTRIEDESIFVDGPVKFMGTVLGANGSPFITGPLPPEFNYVRENPSEQLLFLGQEDAVNFNTVKMYAGDIDIKADSSCNIYCSNGITLNPGYYGSVSIAGSLYDKNGNEITGGSNGGSKYVYDDTTHNNLVLGRATDGSIVNSIFVVGPICLSDSPSNEHSGSITANSWAGGMEIKIGARSDFSGEKAAITIYSEINSHISLEINGQTCELTADDLRKLREILDAHS